MRRKSNTFLLFYIRKSIDHVTQLFQRIVDTMYEKCAYFHIDTAFLNFIGMCISLHTCVHESKDKAHRERENNNVNSQYIVKDKLLGRWMEFILFPSFSPFLSFFSFFIYYFREKVQNPKPPFSQRKVST